jgi:histidyl-tRNA synthetase
MITPQIPKGFRDFLPLKMIFRQKVIEVMTTVFETFGFEPVDTPCIEYAETLEGKYGEEGERLIYKFQDRGGRMVALRYDLTIPLCRIMSMYPEIVKPFKCYHIAPVWRADKPQKGRFREFYQCDIDIIGTDSVHADGELLIITYYVLKELGFKNFLMRINNRKVLNAFALKEGIDKKDVLFFLRSVDKLDKIGPEGVWQELSKKGLFGKDSETRFIDLMSSDAGSNADRLGEMDKLVEGVPVGEEGIKELKIINETLTAHGVPEKYYQFDFTLARGLDYYTGPIFETVVKEPKIGSITGGGRYDNLIGLFSKKSFPATGTSFGLERIVTVMEELVSDKPNVAKTQVLITLFETGLMSMNLKLAKTLREAGIKTEVYFSPDKLKKQLTYASNRGIPFVIILGPDESNEGKVTLKNMDIGKQVTIPQSDMVRKIQENLSR